MVRLSFIHVGTKEVYMGKRIRKKKVVNYWNINQESMDNADNGGVSNGAFGTDMYYFNLINTLLSKGSMKYCNDCKKEIYVNKTMETILGLTKDFWKTHNVEMTIENEDRLGRLIWSEGMYMDYLEYVFQKKCKEKEDE